MTTTIIRNKYNTYHVIDEIYVNNVLQFEQSNLMSCNRFGAKQFKAKNGKILIINSWKWGVKKQ